MGKRLAAAAEGWGPETDEGHWTITDDDIAREAEYQADQARRYAADPTPQEEVWWAQESSAQESADSDGMPDAEYDERADEARALDCLERGCWL